MGETFDRGDFQERLDRLWEALTAKRAQINRSAYRERRTKLLALHEWVETNQKRIHQAATADFKKPPEELDLTEIWPVLTEIKHAVRHLRRWMAPQSVQRTLPTLFAKSWVQYEPKGIALIISPWNYSFSLATGPLIYAIAAGNCAILKPSEFTPNMSRLLEEMVTELYPEDEVAVISGDYRVAEALQDKPFNHVFFTGSPAVGRKVMKAAAKHLASVTLELGGKSPAVVDISADVADTAKKIVYGKFINCGQTCIAPDYVLVHEDIQEKLVTELQQEVKRVFGTDAREQEQSNSYGRLVHDRHFQSIKAGFEKATNAGAAVAIGGEFNDEKRWFAPTVLNNVVPNSPIMEYEIFGPLLPIIPYHNIDLAIDIIESNPKPLALYIFSQDGGTTQRLLQETSAGGTCINDTIVQYIQTNLPFGGTNNSGIGKSHGRFGFQTFSNARAVLRQSKINPVQLVTPPYTAIKRGLIKLILKYL